MKSFWQFLQMMEHSRSSTKSGLYPLGYDGIGNYTPADWLTSSADAIYYLSKDDRIFKTHEASPFNITHIVGPDEVVPPKGHGMPGYERKPQGHGMPGYERQPKYDMPDGKVSPPTQWVKLVTDPELLNPKKFKHAP